MKILKENSTHVAILNGSKIDIFIKGIKFEDIDIPKEILYSIPKEQEDDLFAIFERYEEDARIMLYEFKSMMLN
jgi:hypothetical protein